MDNGDNAFTRLVEGLATNGQPFLGELLESEGNICLRLLLTKITSANSFIPFPLFFIVPRKFLSKFVVFLFVLL